MSLSSGLGTNYFEDLGTLHLSPYPSKICQLIKPVIDTPKRRELFALHLPNPDRVKADYAVLAELSHGLSGGDILNMCVNAIHAGSADDDPTKWRVTQAMIELEIAKARKAKVEHSGKKSGPKRRIGFCV